jgi:hypothetical protein
MSRDFNGSNQYIRFNGSPITAVPITLSVWFRSDSLSANQVIFGIFASSSTSDHLMLRADGAQGGDPVRLQFANQTAVTTTGYSTTAWHHAAGAAISTTLRHVWIDGGSKGTNTTSVNPNLAITNRTTAGRADDNTPGGYFNGRIRDAAAWNVELTDAEIAVLATGFSPLLVRPESLVFYAPLWGRHTTEPAPISGYSATHVNAPPYSAQEPSLYGVAPIHEGEIITAEPPAIYYPRPSVAVPDIGGMISV